MAIAWRAIRLYEKRTEFAEAADMERETGGAPERRDAHGDEVYGRIRSEIQFEIGLINARVNWLIASQAFLFVPLTMGAKGGDIGASPFHPLIPALGVAICALTLVSIVAAVWRSRQWRAKAEQGAYRGDDAAGAFSIIAPRSPAIPRMGMIGALGVPATLLATWAYLLMAPPGAG